MTAGSWRSSLTLPRRPRRPGPGSCAPLTSRPRTCIRRSDLNHLTRSKVLTPAKHVRGPWDRRDTVSVPLYRTGDLDQLAARPGIDWAAVRATPPGRRSPLKRLAEAETVLAVLAALPGPEAE